MRRIFTILFAVSICCVSGRALGQYPQYPGGYVNPSGRPTLSPYLNMLRGGNPAANYYMGVIPERERRFQENRVDRELSNLERRSTPGSEFDDFLPTLEGTGHATYFMNSSPFYFFGTQYGTSGSSPGTTRGGRSSSRTSTPGR
jgi:hypothetical protein